MSVEDLNTGEGDYWQRLEEYKRECVVLRVGAVLPGSHASPTQVLDALVDVRQRLDRTEELLGNAMRLRAAARTTHVAASITVEDQWDEAAVRLRASGVRDEYSSAKERASAANLVVLDSRRVERQLARQVQACDDAVEFLRLRHRGLADIRQEVLALLRHLQFETTLDR